MYRVGQVQQCRFPSVTLRVETSWVGCPGPWALPWEPALAVQTPRPAAHASGPTQNAWKGRALEVGQGMDRNLVLVL